MDPSRVNLSVADTVALLSSDGVVGVTFMSFAFRCLDWLCGRDGLAPVMRRSRSNRVETRARRVPDEPAQPDVTRSVRGALDDRHIRHRNLRAKGNQEVRSCCRLLHGPTSSAKPSETNSTSHVKADATSRRDPSRTNEQHIASVTHVLGQVAAIHAKPGGGGVHLAPRAGGLAPRARRAPDQRTGSRGVNR